MQIESADMVRRLKGGDGAAFNAFVVSFQDRICNLCLFLLHNPHDAQDAAQDTFIKAYRGLRAFEPRSSLYTWLCRIAINTCLDYKRRGNRAAIDENYPLDAIESQGLSPERLYQSKEATESIREALQRLPKKLRAAIVLREIEELSYEEIGEILDISMGTVKSRIARAREELRKSLKGKV